jgi:hypothetical protein
MLPATLEYFPPHKECKFGLNSECRSCHCKRIREWKRINRDRLSARRRELYLVRYGARQRELERIRWETYPIRCQAANLMSGIRERSKKLGFSRPLILCKKEFFMKWLIEQPQCECCGIRFSVLRNPKVKRDDAPSIDRFDTTRGYDLDNIALVCWRCNNIKRNYRAPDLKRVVDWMEGWVPRMGKLDA